MAVLLIFLSIFFMTIAQAGETPKDLKGDKDYKAFYDKYIEGRIAEKARLQASLNPKMSESQKLAIEKQIFSIEKEMFQMETNPAPQLNQVEARIKDMKLAPAQENYLLDMAKKVTNVEDATALLDFAADFTGATVDKTPDAPASLDTPRGEDGGKAVEV
jgi:hypothetical protein